MKRLATIFLSATLLSSSAFAADSAKTLATYAGNEVTEVQVMGQFKEVLDSQEASKGKKFSELDKNMQEALVKSYVNMKLIEKEADKKGIRESKEFKDKIKNVEFQMMQQQLLEDYIKKNVTDKMVDEEYKKLTASLAGQEEVKTSHILVETEEKAKEIKAKINKGGNFVELAKEYSKDEGSKVNGGEIGYVLKGQLVPEYEEKAFAMKKNEVSDPVKTQFGWHVIKMLDKRAAQVPTQEQAMQGIKNKLSKEAVEGYLNKLADEAKVEYKM